MIRRWGRGAALAAVTAAVLGVAAPTTAQEVPEVDLLVTFTDDGIGPAVLDAAGVDGTQITPRVAEVSVTPTEAAELAAEPGVLAVEAPGEFRTAAVPNDPCISGCSGAATYYLESLGITKAWERSTGAGVEIAIIDGGIDPTEPELAGKVIAERNYLGLAPGAVGHGTAVAALAAAVTNNGVGIAGVAPDALLRSYKVIEEIVVDDETYASASVEDVVSAIRDATDDGVEVMNLSLVGPHFVAVQAEIERALSLGVLVVAAAGNIDDSKLVQDPSSGYPARYPGVIAVGASGPDDGPASFSYRGSWVDVFAPGVALAAPIAGGPGHGRFDGTSGATPIVAGAVALLEAVHPGLTPAQVSARLHATSIPLGTGASGERRIHVGSLVRGQALGRIDTANPIGSLDSVVAGPSLVAVNGWTLDPNTTAPIDVHVYVGAVGHALTASAARGDIGAVLPGFGPSHGFSGNLAVGAGTHQVCAYAIDVGPGGNALLGCRVVTVGGSPVGHLDSVQQVPGGVRVSGWALDPDTAGAIQVHAYAGATGIGTTATRSRPDIAKVFPRWGANHGYQVTIPTAAAGTVPVCTYGIDVGAGSNAQLGCRVITLRQDPVGSIDSVVRDGSRVRLRGWALDPSTGASIDVHVYASTGATAVGRADRTRADIAAAFPGYGSAHGYDVSVTAPPGALVCVYGIDQGPGSNALVGCATAP